MRRQHVTTNFQALYVTLEWLWCPAYFNNGHIKLSSVIRRKPFLPFFSVSYSVAEI